MCQKSSHIAVPALDGLAHHRRYDLIGNLDVPDFRFPLRHEVGEQLRNRRHIANLVAAQAEAAGQEPVQCDWLLAEARGRAASCERLYRIRPIASVIPGPVEGRNPESRIQSQARGWPWIPGSLAIARRRRA